MRISTYIALIATGIIALLPLRSAYPQGIMDSQQVIADIIEDLTSKAETDEDYSQLAEDLLELSENKINLNSAKKDDLLKLIFLSDFQVQSLLDYRDSTGSILSIYELQAVPGFDLVDVQRLLPFVKVENAEHAVTASELLGGRNEISIRFKTPLETSAGYSDSYSAASRYTGSKNSYYTRYTYSGGKHFQVGLIAEKDAGEPMFDGTFKTGFDYLSGNLVFSDVGRVKKLVVGDYHAEFGQGLTFWNGISFGKSGNVLSGHKRGRGLVRHSSAYESQYLRGVGLTMPVLKADLTIFGSYRHIDAGIADTLDDGDLAFSSLPETGYHRTTSEIANRNTLQEMVAGANLTYNLRAVKTGLTFFHSEIEGVNAKTLAIYQLEPIRATKNALGMNVDAYLGKHLLFGEVAAELPTMKLAGIAGGFFRLTNTVQLAMIGRMYARDFNPRYTNGFAEGSGVSNERGLYTGLSVLPAKGWKLTTYVDIFKFPWLRYQVNAPSEGREFMAQSDAVIAENFSLTIRYRGKEAPKNLSGSTAQVTPVVGQTTQSLRLQLGYLPLETVRLKTTLEASAFSNDSLATEKGYLVAQDISLNPKRFPLSVNARFAVFDTPSWNSRIYSYESDMLYSFTVPAYYSKGTRLFVMVKYSLKNRLDVWLRYSQTYFSELDELGQGADLVEANTRSEIKAMVRLKF